MSGGTPPASPATGAPSSLEAAWAHLKRHLAWAEPPWIVFVFAAGSTQSRQLAERTREALAASGRTLELRRPGSPEALRAEATALLEGVHDSPVYVDAVRQSLRGDDSWVEAWLWLAQRLNERRDHLLRTAAGGLVLALPSAAKAPVRTVAPDLWTIRSLALELRAEPDPRGAGGFVWLSARGLEAPANPMPSPAPSPVPSLALALTEVERARRRLAEAEASAEDPALRARFARRLASAELDAAVALRDHYRLDEALGHAQAGVARLRASSDGAARSLQRELGRAIGVEADILGRLGRTSEALSAGAEATQRQRDALRTAGPLEETVRAELVATLLAQSAALRGANRLAEALEAAREAVDLSRAGDGVGEGASETAQTTRAACLSALGTILRELERVDEALPVLEEAIASWRALVERGVGTARARLPSSLGNLASVLATLEQPEASLEAVREAVDWLRVLAAESPEAFRPDLAVSLTHLSVRLRDLGRSEEATEAAREAAAIRRELAASAPESFAPGLALSLTALARARADLGALGQARVDSREAVELLWPYFEGQPLAHAPWMRQVLADAAEVFADEEPEWLTELQQGFEGVMAKIEAATE